MGQIQRLVSGLFAAPIQSHTLWGLDIQTNPQESFIWILTCGHCPKHHVFTGFTCQYFTGQSEFHFGAQNHTFPCYNSGGGIRHFSLPQAIKTKTLQLVWGTGPVWRLPRVGREELRGPHICSLTAPYCRGTQGLACVPFPATIRCDGRFLYLHSLGSWVTDFCPSFSITLPLFLKQAYILFWCFPGTFPTGNK